MSVKNQFENLKEFLKEISIHDVETGFGLHEFYIKTKYHGYRAMIEEKILNKHKVEYTLSFDIEKGKSFTMTLDSTKENVMTIEDISVYKRGKNQMDAKMWLRENKIVVEIYKDKITIRGFLGDDEKKIFKTHLGTWFKAKFK